jgi:glycosyltransferase involved in cell wall biosynthesis
MKSFSELPFITVICPVYNEEKYIDDCIQSIIRQDYPKDRLEVFFVDGNSSDRTREIVTDYQKQYAFIHLLDNPEKTTPYAMNIGIKHAKGEYIIRLDGHSAYPDDYFSKLIRYSIDLQADNVGGVIVTKPAKNTSICKAIAIACSHPFGVGNSMFRIGAKKCMQTDTVPFGCYKRTVFSQIGLYDEELTRNQDDELNARLINHGGKIFLIPNIVILYIVRDTFGKMSKMYFQYGLFKPLVNKKLEKPATWRQFFPTLFVCGLVAGAILSCFFNRIWWLYLFVLALYLITSFTIGFCKIKSYEDLGLLWDLPVAFWIIHISYGLGYLVGLYKVITKTKFNATINR